MVVSVGLDVNLFRNFEANHIYIYKNIHSSSSKSVLSYHLTFDRSPSRSVQRIGTTFWKKHIQIVKITSALIEY